MSEYVAQPLDGPRVSRPDRPLVSRLRRVLRAIAVTSTLIVLVSCGGGRTHTEPPSATEPPSTPGSAAVAAVTLNTDAVLLTAAGETKQLVARAFDAAGNEVPGQSFAFSSSAPEQIGVDSSGQVKAIQAVGSALITASVGSVASLPAHAFAAELQAGALVLRDDQIVVAPTLPASLEAVGVGTEFEVVASGIGLPAASTPVVSIGRHSLAGKVVRASAEGANTRLVLAMTTPTETYRSLNVNTTEIIGDLDLSDPAAATQGKSSRLTASAGIRPQALEPKCDYDGNVAALVLTLENKSALKNVKYKHLKVIKDGILIEAEDSLSATMALSAKVVGTAGIRLTGSLKCSLHIYTVRRPIPETPLVVKFPISLNISDTVSFSANELVVGLEIKGTSSFRVGTGYSTEREHFGIAESTSPELKAMPVIDAKPGQVTKPRLTNSIFLGVGIGIGIGLPPDLKAADLDILEYSTGGEFQAKLGRPADTALDRVFDSGYKLKGLSSMKPGKTFGKALELLFGKGTLAIDLNLKDERELAVSPRQRKSTANKRLFNVGDDVTFQVALDAATTAFLGEYNVRKVAIYRIESSGLDTTAVRVAEMLAGADQTDLVLRWAADKTGALVDPDSGDPLYYAFVIPEILSTITNDFFALPIGPVTYIQSWDVADDFSKLNNPNAGRWTQGWCQLAHFGLNEDNYCSNTDTYGVAQTFSALDTWRTDDRRSLGNSAHNGTREPISSVYGLPWELPGGVQTSVTYLPGAFYMHPGIAGTVAQVIWRAPPSGGQFRIRAKFEAVSASSTGVDLNFFRWRFQRLYIDWTDTALPMVKKRFTRDVSLFPNEPIAIGIGNAGNFDFDTTKVDISVEALD